MTDDSETMLTRIEELVATGKYEWCRRTLRGIHRTIEESGVVTLRQQEAVEHIMLGRLRHDAVD